MKLTAEHTDALTEAFNIGVGQAASMLSDLIATRIELRVPRVMLCEPQAAIEYFREHGLDDAMAVLQGFKGPINGQACLVFPKHDGVTLAQLLVDDETASEKMNTEFSGVLIEAGNIVLNGVMGAIANLLDYKFGYDVPDICEHSFCVDIFGAQTDENPNRSSYLLANTTFTVANKDIQGSILIAFEIGAVKTLTKALDALV